MKWVVVAGALIGVAVLVAKASEGIDSPSVPPNWPTPPLFDSW
jgi:hypothetical protein